MDTSSSAFTCRFRSVRRAAAVAAAVMFVCNSTWLAAAAQAGATPGLERAIGTYAVFGRTQVLWEGAVSMPRDVRMGSNDGVVRVAHAALDGKHAYVAAPTVELADGAVVDRVYANALLLDPGATVRNPPAEPFAIPLLEPQHYPTMPPFQCGGADVTVSAGASPYLLTPGTYGIVTVTSGETLDLVPGGEYRLCSLRLRSDSTINVHEDNSIFIAEYLTAGVRVQFAGAGACHARWFARGDKVSPSPVNAAFDFAGGSIDSRSRVVGQFFTDGKLALGHHNDYVGRFWGGVVEASSAATTTRTLAMCEGFACGDGVVDPGEQCDDGNTLENDCCSAFCRLRESDAPCDDGRFCTGTDRCDATGACVGTGDPCPGPDGDEECAESCSEATDSCTRPDADGSACEDGDRCTLTGTCSAGVCRGDDSLDCSDGDLCTYDFCDAGECRNELVPAPSCSVLGESALSIDAGFAPEGRIEAERLIARWSARRDGEPTHRDALGDPVRGDSYALCVFDTRENGPELTYRIDVTPESLPTASTWKRRESRSKLVYSLSAVDGTSAGVSKMRVQVDRHNAVHLMLQAGANPGCDADCRGKFEPPLAAATGRFFAMEPAVIVQWVSTAGSCWAAEYLDAAENTGIAFRATARR